jgi:hypothetical protein
MRFSLFNHYFWYAGGNVPVHDDEELAHRAARPSGLRHQEHRRHYRHAPAQLNPQNKASHVFVENSRLRQF